MTDALDIIRHEGFRDTASIWAGKAERLEDEIIRCFVRIKHSQVELKPEDA